MKSCSLEIKVRKLVQVVQNSLKQVPTVKQGKKITLNNEAHNLATLPRAIVCEIAEKDKFNRKK